MKAVTSAEEYFELYDGLPWVEAVRKRSRENADRCGQLLAVAVPTLWLHGMLSSTRAVWGCRSGHVVLEGHHGPIHLFDGGNALLGLRFLEVP